MLRKQRAVRRAAACRGRGGGGPSSRRPRRAVMLPHRIWPAATGSRSEDGARTSAARRGAAEGGAAGRRRGEIELPTRDSARRNGSFADDSQAGQKRGSTHRPPQAYVARLRAKHGRAVGSLGVRARLEAPIEPAGRGRRGRAGPQERKAGGASRSSPRRRRPRRRRGADRRSWCRCRPCSSPSGRATCRGSC